MQNLRSSILCTLLFAQVGFAECNPSIALKEAGYYGARNHFCRSNGTPVSMDVRMRYARKVYEAIAAPWNEAPMRSYVQSADYGGALSIHIPRIAVQALYGFNSGVNKDQEMNSPEFMQRSQMPDLMAVAKSTGGSGKTEVHILSSLSGHQAFSKNVATALGPMDDRWTVLTTDFNQDGWNDLVALYNAPGEIDVHVLSGVTHYQTFLMQARSGFGPTNAASAQFLLHDFNRDGYADLALVYRQGALGTEIHVRSGADGFQTLLLATATALGRTDGSWEFGFGDRDRDGIPDLFALAKQGGSGTTEVHVLSGASGYRTFLLQTATVLGRTDAMAQLTIRDADGDDVDDLVMAHMRGGSGKTEMHVLSGATNFQSWIAQRATILGYVPADWRFLPY